MKREDSIGRLDEMLAQHLHREHAVFDFDQWARRFPEDAGLLQSGFPQPARDRKTQLLHIGRCIVTSHYTKLAGVAAMVLVAVSFLFPGRHGIVPESVAWADVQEAMEQVHTIRVTGTRNFFFSQDDAPTYRLGLEKLFSFSRGYVDRTFAENGQLMIEFAYDLPTGTITVLFPTQKRYYRTQAPEMFHDKTSQVTFQEFGEWLFVSGDYHVIGPNDVQGIQAIGFEVSDLLGRLKAKLGFDSRVMDLFFSHGDFSARMWVDPETRRPIQLEAEGKVNPCLVTGFREMTLREIDDRWEFDVDLDAVQFVPTIPDDYTEFKVTDLPSAEAKAGLVGLGMIPAGLLFWRRWRTKRTARHLT